MAYNTITIDSNQPTKEGIASGSIYPGMLLERTSTADTVKAHSLDQQKVHANLVAVEDSLQGNDIDDVYATTKRIFFKAFLPGDVVYAYIAAGQNVSIGDKLVSNGSGYLEKESNDSSAIENVATFGTALVAVNATVAAARTLVEVA